MKIPLVLRLSSLVAAACAAFAAHAADTTVSSLDNPNGTTTVAAGDTLTVIDNVTQTTDTDAGRFNKAGDGTLILKGANNTFKRLNHSDGKLVFDGGATTVSGGTGTGVGVGNNFVLDGDEVVITGGANVTVGAPGNSKTQYPILRSVSMVVTNGTFDMSASTTHALCNFKNGDLPLKAAGQTVTVGEGGLFRTYLMRPFQPGTDAAAAAVKDKYGFNIVDGGVLELDGVYALRIDGQQYGFIHFDSGVLVNNASSGNTIVPCYLNYSGDLANQLSTTALRWSNARLSVGEGGAVISNAVSKNMYLPVPFRNAVSGGAADGGLHFSGKGTTYLYATGATYNGGTHLESTDGGILALNAAYGDSSLGAVPASPETNLWVRGSNHTLYNQEGEFTIHSNRTTFVKNGITFYTGANANARLVFGGLVKGETVGGLSYSTNTTFRVRDNWSGTTVLSPGAGRTNDLGRLVVLGALEVTNGVTMIASTTAGTTVNDAMLYVSAGNAAGSGTKGRLLVRDGGVLSTPQTSLRYVAMGNYGQADICGGTVVMPNVEWLNAMNAPALTTVRDGGFLNVATFRISQGVTTGNPTVVRLGTNGLMRVNQLALDLNKDQPDVTFLFDGGAIQSGAGYSAADEGKDENDKTVKASFIRDSSNAKWDGVKFAIGPGGAVFDTSNNKNLYWYRPLVKATADAPDGGITARGIPGQAKAVCLMKAAVYNGPTTIDGTTLQQRGGDNLIPAGTKLVLKNRGILGCTTYDTAHTPTATSFNGVEGDGELRWCAGVAISGTIAPSIGGAITFTQRPESISNATLSIAGDATGCGKVDFNYEQDLSALSLSVSDISAFDKHADKGLYKIVEGNYCGTFASPSGLGDDWAVSYRADGVYLSHQDAFVIVVK